MDRVQGISLFIRVVETGSFSKAAEDLGITQPTATKFVASMEKRLGVLLLHRSTRGVTTTEIGKLYYEKCKLIAREIEEADDLASLLQSKVRGKLTISSSVAFGRRVLMPTILEFMSHHPELEVNLNMDDRYINLIEQGVDLAIRMRRLPDSSLGSRMLGMNPWVLVATPDYLKKNPAPKNPSDIRKHQALIYTTVQGDHRWNFTNPNGKTEVVEVTGPFTSNNLSSILSAARTGMGLAVLPWYVAHQSVKDKVLKPIMEDWSLPTQEIHAVFSSPKHVPTKVSQCIDWLQTRFKGEWWKGVSGSKNE
ncbi:MAG: LysR family transcriptional regulator [Polynucleobacter sp. 32-46-5]|jgi:DNA-binding transcriptional LysR family regulator|nr:MAG: LysR family transcriptional regulator [Polynucleobacter sp. 32-46-5]OZA40514.1 MAG: LysR family transcriptional regulator [Polynucleobacter sp. 17-46-58]HQR84912.1 LysR family transcriptional regulator [Polynucleobacter sp.]HQS61304.1 LysR family transcriptional regulator [Polynucleobacter sp.]HQT21156.1 LysR family transcriptional regulator [Polynucleobacter sp.]